MLWNNLIINLGRSVLKLVTTCLLTTQLRILSIFSSNLINYNHDVYKGIAWISRKICRSGLVDEEMEPTHEDDRDILLLGWVGWEGPPICPNNPEPPIVMVHWKMEVSPIELVLTRNRATFFTEPWLWEKEYVQPCWKTEQLCFEKEIRKPGDVSRRLAHLGKSKALLAFWSNHGNLPRSDVLGVFGNAQEWDKNTW